MSIEKQNLLSVLKQKSEEPFYPLIPHFRYTGEKYLLLWHTHNEQHQVFVADSVTQAINLWGSALKSEGLEASAKEFWKASIVLPPDWIAEKYHQYCYKEDLYNFVWHTGWQIGDYVKRHKKLPPNIGHCLSTDHDDCECFDTKYRVLSGSWHSLFKKDWNPPTSWTGSVRAARKRKLEPFAGIPANLNKTLYVCELNGGHHSRGITLSEVKEDTRPRRDSTLFFFHGEKLVMPVEIVESIDNLKKQEALKKKKHERETYARQIAREKEADDWLIKTLN